MGLLPISIIGFGLLEVSSDNLVPKPPAKIIAFTLDLNLIEILTYVDLFYSVKSNIRD